MTSVLAFILLNDHPNPRKKHLKPRWWIETHEQNDCDFWRFVVSRSAPTPKFKCKPSSSPFPVWVFILVMRVLGKCDFSKHCYSTLYASFPTSQWEAPAPAETVPYEVPPTLRIEGSAAWVFAGQRVPSTLIHGKGAIRGTTLAAKPRSLMEIERNE